MARLDNEQHLSDDLKLKNINYLKDCYKKYIRNDFLESFEALYCKSSMNDPFLNQILKTYCNHQDTNKEINFKHYELMMYVTNIIAWLDSKMDQYDNGPTTRSISKHTNLKTCYDHNEEHISRSYLHNKCIGLGKNELSHVTYQIYQNNDFSSMNDTKIICDENSKDVVIHNSQDDTIFTDIQINNINPDDNSKNRNEDIFTNHSVEEINKVSKDFIVNDSQDNSIFTDIQLKNIDPDENSKDKNEESLINNPVKENIDLNESFESKIEESLTNNTVEEINKDKSIFMDIQLKNIDPDENSKDKNEESLINNPVKENIDLNESFESKIEESLNNNSAEEINKDKSIFTDIQLKNIDPDENSKDKNEESLINNPVKENIDLNESFESKIEESLNNNSAEEINKVSEDLVINDPQDNTSFTDLQIKNVDPDDSFKNKNEESLIDNLAKENIDPDNNKSSTNNPEEDINKIFKNMENNISYVMESSAENIDSKDISNNTNKEDISTPLDISNIKKITSSKSLKNNVTAIIEKKLCPVQSTCANVTSESQLDVCLETSSTKNEQYFNYVNEVPKIKPKSHKKSKKTSNFSTTRNKRCNSAITDSEYISKKKKMENLSASHAEENNHDVSKSVKVSSDSTKKVDKNMYCKNSKGETKLHAACAKGKLDLVTLLLVNGFNPNVKDNAGWTPLHEAVKNGHYLIVKKLIDYGAYLNVPGFEYESPLYTAIKYDQFDIALLLFQNGADIKCINMYGMNAQSLNEERCYQLINNQIPHVSSETKYVYESDQTILFMFKVTFKNAVMEQFCKQFNIKLVQNILNEKELKQVTHIVLPEMENNTCDINMEILIGIANGLFIVHQRWIFDSLKENKLLNCENYEVSGIKNFIDYNGPKISRINKQNLCPKLFDGICIYLSGNIGWESFSLEQLKKLVLAFGAKLLTRMPNPENCPTNIIPYHCRNNKKMYHVSTIILYTIDSNRLIKYNMKHLKTFPISWFMKTVQEYTIM